MVRCTLYLYKENPDIAQLRVTQGESRLALQSCMDWSPERIRDISDLIRANLGSFYQICYFYNNGWILLA
uniref:Uncharacterized protein n=2 Tax=Picea TaxID=3328 RepID=A0A117NJ01_PICGL|nr:hypothetical protein ABT39_MTgene641 [Picea glauca]QHR92611.1 hypothetical protein Q903MT_gene6658 [Picea sitchensis]